MSPPDVDFLLVGAGAASESCARTLRELGADGSILLVGRELDPPYDRPEVSKGYLLGTIAREQAYLHPPDWWKRHAIELRSRTSVLRLDPVAHVATLSSKESVRFGCALLATGATVRRLRAPGDDLDGIHYLRALGNADAIRADVANADRVVLVGGSYIGCEVAAALTHMGKRCTVLMQEATTLEHHIGAMAGAVVQSVLAQRGVRFVAGDALARFEGSDGRVQRVVTAGGRALDADAVVIGIGALPDATLARAAGLELAPRGGVAADAGLRSSTQSVWVAGDMCEWESDLHGGRVRVEHWEVAVEHGRTVARNMLGGAERHAAVPYFWSDLCDWLRVEMVGPLSRWDREVTRGVRDDPSFSQWYFDGERLVGALSIGRPQDLLQARRLLADGARGEHLVSALPDMESDLAELA